MRITAVHCWKEDLDLKRPYTIAYHTVSAVENIFVLLQCDNGYLGIGAGAPAGFVTGEETEKSLENLSANLKDLLLGLDVRQIESALRQTRKRLATYPAARAAIDIALHDLWGQFLELPLVEYFGRVHQELPTSITIGIKDSIEETLAEAQEFMQLGFQIIKLKTGQSLEADIATFRRLRETVGPSIKIRIDANQGYSPDDLIAFAKATTNLDVEFYEQPLPPDQLAKMQNLPTELAMQCAADENLHHPSDAIALAVHPKPFGIYNIKLMKCGGISEARHIATVAERSGIKLMWGCMDESIVSISAALHAALASPATHYLDLDGSFDLAHDLVTDGFMLRNGCLSTTAKPGLGLTLSERLNNIF